MVIDLPTLIVMTLVNMFIALVAALFVWRVNRPMAGLSTMAGGLGVICISFAIAFFAKPFVGKAASWFGNLGMILGMLIILHGTRQFRGFYRLPSWILVSLGAPFAVAQTYFFFVHDSKPIRHSVFAVTIAAICFAGAWTMSCRMARDDRFTYCVSALGLMIYGSVQTMRAVWVLLPGQEGAADKGLLPTITLLTLNVCLIGCLLGLSTATNLRLRKRIEKLAFCDPLTGLPNRRTFDERLDLVHAHSIATGSPVALIYVDLDRFKTINDRFGHAAGDMALKEAAERLQSAVHPDDCLARIGGDEFVVLTERFSIRADVLELVIRLQHSLRDPINVAGSPVYLSVSCGIAFYPEDVADTYDLIRKADAGMYIEKRMAALG